MAVLDPMTTACSYNDDGGVLLEGEDERWKNGNVDLPSVR